MVQLHCAFTRFTGRNHVLRSLDFWNGLPPVKFQRQKPQKSCPESVHHSDAISRRTPVWGSVSWWLDEGIWCQYPWLDSWLWVPTTWSMAAVAPFPAHWETLLPGLSSLLPFADFSSRIFLVCMSLNPILSEIRSWIWEPSTQSRSAPQSISEPTP